MAIREMKRLQVDDWADAASNRQFQLAGHTSRTDGGRWCMAALSWTPDDGGRKWTLP